VLAISLAAWIVTIGASAATAVNLSCIRMIDERWPEPEAAEFMRQNDLSGRMITWFNWGEYAIWHFAPDIQVSMDGRRETIYTDTQIQGHLGFYFDQPGALSFARDLAPDYIWLPKGLPVVRTLLDDGWNRLYEGSMSILLSEQPRAVVTLLEPQRQGRRCFPGP